MKKVFVVCMLMLAYGVSHAWERTQTLVNSNGNNGMYIGPVLRFAQEDTKWGLMYGARAGITIDRKLGVGGAVYGMAQNTMKSDYLNASGDKINYNLSYGGLEFEYLINADDLVHASCSVLLGVGSTGLAEATVSGNTNGSSSFYVFEPGVNAIVNVSTNLRLYAGIHYRLATGVDSKILTNEKVNGPSFSIGFMMGMF